MSSAAGLCRQTHTIDIPTGPQPGRAGTLEDLRNSLSTDRPEQHNSDQVIKRITRIMIMMIMIWMTTTTTMMMMMKMMMMAMVMMMMMSFGFNPSNLPLLEKSVAHVDPLAGTDIDRHSSCRYR